MPHDAKDETLLYDWSEFERVFVTPGPEVVRRYVTEVKRGVSAARLAAASGKSPEPLHRSDVA